MTKQGLEDDLDKYLKGMGDDENISMQIYKEFRLIQNLYSDREQISGAINSLLAMFMLENVDRKERKAYINNIKAYLESLIDS